MPRVPTFSVTAASAFALFLLMLAPGEVYSQSVSKSEDPVLARAREQYDRARALGQKGKFEEARKLLEDTWKLKKHWEIAAYLARAELKTGHYRSAAEHSAYALRVITVDADPDERRQLERQYSEAKAQIGTVHLRSVEPNAIVSIDGHDREPVFAEDPLFLHPGPHEIEVRKGDRPARKRTITAEGGTTTELDMSAEAIARSLAASTEPPVAPASVQVATPTTGETWRQSNAHWQPRTWVAATEGVLGAVALGVGVGFLLRAESLDREAKDSVAAMRGLSATPCATPSAQCTEISKMYQDRDKAADWAKVGIITGGVLGLATVTTLLLWPARAAASSTNARSPGARGYWVSPGTGMAAGLTVGGTF